MLKELVLICLLLCYSNYVYCQHVGDFCTLNSGESGQCEIITDCPSALEDLKKQIFPTHCGFQGTQAIVCCKSDNGNPAPPPITTSSTTTTTTTRTTPKVTVRGTTPETPAPSNYTNPPGIGHKARAKCLEYGEYVFEYIFSAGLLPTNKRIKRDECGHTVVKLIVGGTKTKPKEFPHMALLGYNNGDQKVWKCGGSLISESYILTAGHCLYSRDYGYVAYALLGDLDVKSSRDDSEPQEFEIPSDGIIKYPKYTTKSKYNDLGLLKMNRPAKLNPYVRPACLYTEDIVKTERAIATGWGKQDYAGAESSHLLKVVLDMYTNPQCNDNYPSESKLDDGIIDTQLCAGSLDDTQKDTCQGDSGGPLQIYNNDVYCTYNVIGVTSFGKACGLASTPGVYTKISKYIEWIENTVWP